MWAEMFGTEPVSSEDVNCTGKHKILCLLNHRIKESWDLTGPWNIAWSNALFGLGFVSFSLGEGVLIEGVLFFLIFVCLGFLFFWVTKTLPTICLFKKVGNTMLKWVLEVPAAIICKLAGCWSLSAVKRKCLGRSVFSRGGREESRSAPGQDPRFVDTPQNWPAQYLGSTVQFQKRSLKDSNSLPQPTSDSGEWEDSHVGRGLEGIYVWLFLFLPA